MVKYQTLMVAILFKNTFAVIVYNENDPKPKLNGLKGIFRFCKIFRDVGKAVNGMPHFSYFSPLSSIVLCNHCFPNPAVIFCYYETF